MNACNWLMPVCRFANEKTDLVVGYVKQLVDFVVVQKV